MVHHVSLSVVAYLVLWCPYCFTLLHWFIILQQLPRISACVYDTWCCYPICYPAYLHVCMILGVATPICYPAYLHVCMILGVATPICYCDYFLVQFLIVNCAISVDITALFHYPICSLIHCVIDSLSHWFTVLLIHCLIGSLCY